VGWGGVFDVGPSEESKRNKDSVSRCAACPLLVFLTLRWVQFIIPADAFHGFPHSLQATTGIGSSNMRLPLPTKSLTVNRSSVTPQLDATQPQLLTASLNKP
jgi:hypothetical protein